MIRFAELVLVISALIAINVSITAANSSARVRCTDNAGRLLYEVEGARVLDLAGLLGTVENGDVRKPNGEVIARNGDAGSHGRFATQKSVY